jgi:SAM-dependent methyltransferase
VEKHNQWSVPVDPDTIQRAKNGDWEIVVTPIKPVPKSWFPPVKEKTILCLASGGGQQGPVLAAAGGNVTVLDISENQLQQDRLVARREGLSIRTVKGDMTNLEAFRDEEFDLIIHPVSNLFVKDIQKVWNEAFRVLKKGGTLISGFMNPVFFLFDWDLQEKGILQVKHPIPYSDLDYLTEEELKNGDDMAIEFGHTLEDQIQGQIKAGFRIEGFYEDTYGGQRLIDQYTSTFIATKAVKPL